MARVVLFDKLVRRNMYPNRVNFGAEYGVAVRTIARDVEYIKDRLGAPLEYDKDRGGYYYREPWEIPSIVVVTASKEERVDSLIKELKKLEQSELQYVVKHLIPSFTLLPQAAAADVSVCVAA